MDELDNLRQESARPLGVTSGDLERALRESLSRAANPSHGVGGHDPAGRAIRRGRRIGRRRSAVGAVLLVVAVAAATAGVTQLNPGGQRYSGPAWEGDLSPLPETAGPVILETPTPGSVVIVKPQAVDLVLAGQLRTASGKVLDLTPVGSITQAHETDDGWLVVSGSQSGDATLWFVMSNGERRELLHAVDSIVLASDGRRIAWRDSARLFSAIVDKGQVKDARQVTAPTDGLPVSFVGPGVVMERDVSGLRVGGYDVWWPEQEATYVPTWQEEAAGIYGPRDARTVVGQVYVTATDQPCLALFDAVNALTVLKTACALQFNADGRGAVSPDGRWLVADATGADTAMLVDLNQAFTAARPTASRAGSGLAGTGTWTDNSTLVHPARDGSLVTVKAAAKPEVESTEVPGAADGAQVLVVARALR